MGEPVSSLNESLSALDSMNVDALVLVVHPDEKPLRGTAGFADWRLNGWLSSLRASDAFAAEDGEVMLASSNGRIAAKRIFAFGTGTAPLTPRPFIENVIRVLTKADVNRVALAEPGFSGVFHRESESRRFLRTAREIMEEAGMKGLLIRSPELPAKVSTRPEGSG